MYANIYSYQFRQWYPHTMTRRQLAIIEKLERQRRHSPDHQVRAYIADNGAHRFEIYEILVAYLRWHSQEVSPQHQAAIYSRIPRKWLTRQDLQIPRRLPVISMPHVNNVRGRTIALNLIFDLYHPTRNDYFDQVRSVVQPMAEGTRGSIIIYVGNPQRGPAFKRRKPRQFARAYHAHHPPNWQTIDVVGTRFCASTQRKAGLPTCADPPTVGTRFCASAPGWQNPPKVEQPSRLRTHQPGTAGFPARTDPSQNYALCIHNYALDKIA